MGEERDETLVAAGVEAREEHHEESAEGLRRVAGQVERIYVLSREYAWHDGAWRPVEGAFRLREVARSPDNFVYVETGEHGPRWKETGMVVEVAETSGRP